MQPHTVSASGPPQPIPVDITGDLKIDLFGVQPLALSQFQVWKNVWNTSDPSANTLFELYALIRVLCPRRNPPQS